MNENLTLLLSIIKAQTILAKKFDRLHVHGLGISDFMVLNLLNSSHNKQSRRIDLADQMGLSASGITRLLLPLEKTGLVSRQTNARDARVSFVVLTQAGERVFKEARKTADQIAREIIPNIKPSTLEATMRLLKELNAAF